MAIVVQIKKYTKEEYIKEIHQLCAFAMVAEIPKETLLNFISSTYDNLHLCTPEETINMQVGNNSIN